MSLKVSIPTSFHIFSPPTTTHRPSTSTTELRFSRWNNANAESFEHRRLSQSQIEHDLRLHRRYQSISNLSNPNPNSNPQSIPTVHPKSHGSPSSPSPSSIPGKRSKYSKPPPNPNHPAFKKHRKPRFTPESDPENGIVVSDKGVGYRIKNAPFEFQYSYTETPKVKPVALREQPYLPFGPGTMPRPWTGKRPLPESKKKVREFDSFVLPPAGKKGVKPVQAPGPYLEGMGPRERAMTREEVLGEPLTGVEVTELVKGALKMRRQLNMGRDGLTHNMLDNIHALWKRRRVCKIKCKGVCTVDMDNVQQQLEEKTGGKIIYCKGGVIYLFRGRNYNYRTRPKFPLMLWKPAAPVYPRLVPRAPEGLTLEEASEMRKRGRQLPPICKLGKNGVYVHLVKHVKEAFEACELVRINCKDMNKSDVRKIGAKLKDLVPCVLISFEYEHILMWRGKDWKSSLPPPQVNHVQDIGLIADDSRITSIISDLKGQEFVESLPENNTNVQLVSKTSSESMPQINDVCMEEDLALSNELSGLEDNKESPPQSAHVGPSEIGFLGSSQDLPKRTNASSPQSKCLDRVMLLLRQAVENGSAMILEDEPLPLDANTVYERSVTLAKSAPAGPVFLHRIRKVAIVETDKDMTENHEEEDVHFKPIIILDELRQEKKPRSRKEYYKKEDEVSSEVIPHGSLRIDELAKLLA